MQLEPSFLDAIITVLSLPMDRAAFVQQCESALPNVAKVLECFISLKYFPKQPEATEEQGTRQNLVVSGLTAADSQQLAHLFPPLLSDDCRSTIPHAHSLPFILSLFSDLNAPIWKVLYTSAPIGLVA